MQQRVGRGELLVLYVSIGRVDAFEHLSKWYLEERLGRNTAHTSLGGPTTVAVRGGLGGTGRAKRKDVQAAE